MTSPWPLEIDGYEYQPIPESWIQYGTDADRGSPRVYAVSVAHDVRNRIRMRYATVDGRVYPVKTTKRENPTGEGYVPAKLATKKDWIRSLVPRREVSSVDVLRSPEVNHMRELWSDRLDDLEDFVDQEDDVDGADRELVADGGVETCPECSSGPFYPNGGPGAYWCEECKREFWQEGDQWYSCGLDGDPSPVEPETVAEIEILYQQRMTVKIPVDEIPPNPESAFRLVKNYDPEFIADAIPNRWDDAVGVGHLDVVDIQEADRDA